MKNIWVFMFVGLMAFTGYVAVIDAMKDKWGWAAVMVLCFVANAISLRTELKSRV